MGSCKMVKIRQLKGVALVETRVLRLGLKLAARAADPRRIRKFRFIWSIDGETFGDGYWAYSTKYDDWYYLHQDGKTTWASQQDSRSRAKWIDSADS